MKEGMRNLAILIIVLTTLSALISANTIYVDTLGTDDPAHGIGPGVNAMRTVSYAVSQASGGDSIIVGAGTFAEDINVNISVCLLGNNADKSGTDASRTDETVLCSASAGFSVITVSADNVTICGFTIDGNNGSAADQCIVNDFINPINDLIIRNNIIQDAAEQGIYLDGPGTRGSNNTIEYNYITNIINEPGEWQMTTNHSITGRGIVLQNNIYADIISNTIDDVYAGVYTRTFSALDTCVIDSNYIAVNANNVTDGSWFTPEVPSKPGLGISIYQHSGSSYFYISNNTIKKYNAVTDSFCNGITIIEIYDSAGIYCYHNIINDMTAAYSLFNCPTANTLTIRGCEMGVDTSKNPVGVGINLSNVIADDMGLFGPNYSYAQNSSYIIDSVRIYSPLKWGIYQFGQDNATPGTVHMELSNSTIERGLAGESDHANINIYNYNRTAVTANITNCIIRNSQNRGINIVGNGEMNINHCEIYNNSSYGIMLRNRANATSNILNCIMYNNSVHVNLDYETTTNTTNLFNNSFTGTGRAVRNYRNVAIDIVNAYCNWFGSNTEAGVIGSFTNMSGYIDYSPWLHDSTNTCTGTGFESDMLGLNVSYSSPNVTGDGFATEALNYLADNGTVYLKDGSYNETVTIDKNCTFNNTGVSDIDCIDLLTAGCTLNLIGNLTVNDSVVCSNACINTGTDTLILSGASLSGESSVSHIDGFIMLTDNVGTGASAMGNMGINIVAGADDLGNVTVVRQSGPGTEVSIQTLSKKWHITSDNPPISGRNITFNWYSNDDNSINISNAFLMSSTDNSAPESYIVNAGPFDASSRSITQMLSSFSYWTVSDNASLPVQTINCTAGLINGDVVLSWHIESITDKIVRIERKNINSEYSTIALIEPGSSSYRDSGLKTGIYTYRISLADNSSINAELKVSVNGYTRIADFNIIENGSFLSVKYSLPESSSYSIDIYDITGMHVMNYTPSDSYGMFRLEKSRFSAGIYFITAAGSNAKEKFVILK